MQVKLEDLKIEVEVEDIAILITDVCIITDGLELTQMEILHYVIEIHV